MNKYMLYEMYFWSLTFYLILFTCIKSEEKEEECYGNAKFHFGGKDCEIGDNGQDTYERLINTNELCTNIANFKTHGSRKENIYLAFKGKQMNLIGYKGSVNRWMKALENSESQYYDFKCLSGILYSNTAIMNCWAGDDNYLLIVNDYFTEPRLTISPSIGNKNLSVVSFNCNEVKYYKGDGKVFSVMKFIRQNSTEILFSKENEKRYEGDITSVKLKNENEIQIITNEGRIDIVSINEISSSTQEFKTSTTSKAKSAAEWDFKVHLSTIIPWFIIFLLLTGIIIYYVVKKCSNIPTSAAPLITPIKEVNEPLITLTEFKNETSVVPVYVDSTQTNTESGIASANTALSTTETLSPKTN